MCWLLSKALSKIVESWSVTSSNVNNFLGVSFQVLSSTSSFFHFITIKQIARIQKETAYIMKRSRRKKCASHNSQLFSLFTIFHEWNMPRKKYDQKSPLVCIFQNFSSCECLVNNLTQPIFVLMLWKWSGLSFLLITNNHKQKSNLSKSVMARKKFCP